MVGTSLPRHAVGVALSLREEHLLDFVVDADEPCLGARGARVISTSEWSRDDTIMLAVPGFHFTSAARVAYCEALGDGRFVTGLEFVPASPHLEITALAATFEFPRRTEPIASFRAQARRLSQGTP